MAKISGIKIVQSGDKIKQEDNIWNNAIEFVIAIIVQLIPIWILTLIRISIQDVPIRIGTLIENMLVYNIVVCAGNVVATKDKGGRSRLLAVIIIIAASIAFYGEYMSSSGIGGVGFKIQTWIYISVTTALFQLTSIVQYYDIIGKQD